MTKPTIPFFYDYVLPNTILPNALPLEMGLVNYIHTQYSDRLTSESFFDEGLENYNSPYKQMFGDKMGEMPNSLRMNGSYLRSPCYTPSIDVLENSAYFGRRTLHADGYRRYVYPIKVTLHFPMFTGTAQVGSKLNGEYFWKHISESVLRDLRKGDAIVFLDWSNENFIDRTDFCNLHDGIRYSGIPRESIVLTVNSFNAQQVYESWFSNHERLLQVRNLPFILCQISWWYAVNPERRLDVEKFKATRDSIRPNYFLFPIRRGRDHRLALLYKYASEGILNKGNWSMHDPAIHFDRGYGTVKHGIPLGYDESTIRDIHQYMPKGLDEEPNSNFSTVSGWDDHHADHNKNAYFYVATETYMHGPYKSMTEKVFKPIANFNPFLLASFSGALAELRKLGFKTFSGFIDESYDEIQDTASRLQAIATETKRLCSMSREELHNWYWSMEDILIHNHNRLMEIYLNEPHSKQFIDFLYNRVKN